MIYGKYLFFLCFFVIGIACFNDDLSSQKSLSIECNEKGGAIVKSNGNAICVDKNALIPIGK